VAADYRWLQGEIAGALAAAANAAPAPRPNWRGVEERLFTARRRQTVERRTSAFAGAALVICLMLAIPNLLGPAVVAQIPPPEGVMAPPPVTAAVSGGGAPYLATSTPAMYWRDEAPSPTPAFALPPTPQLTKGCP